LDFAILNFENLTAR